MASETASKSSRHLLAIDALRGLAALGVAFFHGRENTWVGTRAYFGAPHAFTSIVHGSVLGWFDALFAAMTFPVLFGSIGVPIFFVLSGYCIHRGQARKLLANPGYRMPVGNFLLRRFVRIYPVLVGALLLTWALDSVSLTLAPLQHKLLTNDISLRSFLVNLFALQGVDGSPYGTNGSLWTLSIEIQFYLVYPLALDIRRRLGLSTATALVFGLNIASYFLLEQWWGPAHPRYETHFFTSYYASWWFGVWLAERRLSKVENEGKVALAGLAVVLAGCWALYKGPTPFWAMQLWSAGFALAFPYLLTRLGDGSAVRAFAKIGEFSYSLYAVHYPMFILLVCWLFSASKPHSIFVSVALTVLVTGASYLFHLIFERPAMRWLDKHPARAPATAAAAV